MGPFLSKRFNLHEEFLSKSPVKTRAFAWKFAGKLRPGNVIGLTGGLGAGKTHFIKGAARYFNVPEKNIVSPTFNLVKEHKSKGSVIYHFDFYRLKNIGDLEKIGYRDYITDRAAVIFLEWPDRIKETWKDMDWVVVLEHKGGDKRKIRIFKSKLKSQNSKVRLKKLK
jgi:tRNA threonylcarbamoyladenosine biosynthesis protein TsaE